MPIVTLTTDWTQDDYYTAAIKGRLLSACPGLQIVDITHSIPPFNTARAAFVVKNSYHHFPAGTIHLICVNSEPSAGEAIVALKYEEHFLIGNDNGIFGLIIKNEPEAVVELTAAENALPGFVSLGVFVNAASRLVSGVPLEEIGIKREKLARSIPRRATIDKDVIIGSVIYIDSYDNAITNITKELYNRIGQGRQFEIALQSNHYKLNRINRTYGETSVGELLVLFNSLGLLEVAINRGNAAELLSLNTSSTIRIRFFEKNNIKH